VSHSESLFGGLFSTSTGIGVSSYASNGLPFEARAGVDVTGNIAEFKSTEGGGGTTTVASVGTNGAITSSAFVKDGGLSTQFLMADGSVTTGGGGSQNLQQVTDIGATTTNNITANSFIKTGGTSSQFLKADGSTSTLTNPITGTGTTNYLSKFTGTTSLGDSLIYDNGANVSIGSTTGLGLFNVAGSKTAASAIARGTHLTPTLVASANSDVLVGLDIAPTYTLGAFTGVQKIAIRTSGDIQLANNVNINALKTNGQAFLLAKMDSSDTSTFGNLQSGTQLYGVGIEFRTTNGVGAKLFNSTNNLTLQNGGTFTDVASSRLTVNSTTQGFLPPRMTNAQRISIATPAVGLMVYCTDTTEGLYINKSTGWTFIV
jgi:hypothetical protein